MDREQCRRLPKSGHFDFHLTHTLQCKNTQKQRHGLMRAKSACPLYFFPLFFVLIGYKSKSKRARRVGGGRNSERDVFVFAKNGLTQRNSREKNLIIIADAMDTHVIELLLYCAKVNLIDDPAPNTNYLKQYLIYWNLESLRKICSRRRLENPVVNSFL